MNIIILGAGQVGSSLATLLSRDPDNDITLVDVDTTHLQKLQDHLDIRTIAGHASDPAILEEAGLEMADMLIAVTRSDETNLVACQLAYLLHKTQTKIARIRNTAYLNRPELFDYRNNPDAMPVDVLISPENLVTEHILRLVQYPGALQVVDFADGKVRLVAYRAHRDGRLVGKTVQEIKATLPPGVETRIVAIYRRDEVVIPSGDTTIEVGDEVFFLARPEQIETIAQALRGTKVSRSRHIMIAGGGNIGLALAQALEKDHIVKVIEQNLSRARYLAEHLDHAIVVQGDITDKELLLDENIDEVGLFIAVTNYDEANIISSLLAKKLGVKRVISLINNNTFIDLLHLNQIDVAISADQITTNRLLHYLREGDTVRAVTLRRGAAEAMEVVLHGSENSSQVIGKRLIDIPWPEKVTVGAIVRNGEVLFARKDLELEAEDHIILFAADPRTVDKVYTLFAPEQPRKRWF
ncbi:trk system potassium uptake protein TrkA [Sulfurivirga caldicuralii]|uniref:Trk system potassium uptake protein TrkA n=1 Tax=Sulfurivirga caldicuralii TaxID=364032 RepID=A0A1N6DIU5_9GAMM|nr:Trk system potassium transporter TrkA [Sulfurivirga caldicuralii]SIN70583.1 trk system potassium uptake protein TrkA [Sulfurivirga caldicuralii]